MRTRLPAILFVVLLALVSAIPDPGVAVAADPFAVTAMVTLCTSDPQTGEGSADNCNISAEGIGITVSVEGEGVLGACQTESEPTPNGGIANWCSVDGAELNSTLVFELDESTLPGSFTLHENPIVVEVGDLIPGGGESGTANFLGWLTESPPNNEPQTGFFADIVEGTCDEPGQSVATLNAVERETGAAVGQVSAIRPEVSFSTVDVSLDVLIDVPHAVSIYGVNANAGDRVLCGEIGGVDNDDGTLHIGLRDMAGTGASGLASLSYNESNGDRTDVTLFLIPAP